MASIVQRIKAYLRSPEGQRKVRKAKDMARDPRNQQKARDFMSRWRRKPRR
jgi:hypothetical protein